MLCVSMFAFYMLINRGKVNYYFVLIKEKQITTQEYVVRKRSSVHTPHSRNDMLFRICLFFNIQQDYCYPRDSLGKVLYFVDKAEQGVNRLVSFYIACAGLIRHSKCITKMYSFDLHAFSKSYSSNQIHQYLKCTTTAIMKNNSLSQYARLCFSQKL